MTTGSKRVLLAAATSLAAAQASLGAWFVVSGYTWWAAIIFVGGLAAVAGLITIPKRPKFGGALAYLGSLLGMAMWVSIVGVLLTCLLMPAILGMTVIYDDMRTSAVAKLVVWSSSVLLLWVCIFGLLLVAALIAPVPAGFWILAIVILQVPVVVIVLASLRSQDPANIIARARG